MQSHLLICLATCALAFLLLCVLDNLNPSHKVCVLHITGESVRLHNCDLTPELVESVSKLQPLRLDTLSLQ
ncbi:triple gene block protein 3 [Butterbur mosaic virus]|uniref:Movement protein TGBp3 n=1 Tax=Butterbur mosaic virus TaxID=666859 RepID=D2Z045_9VIRU|nr:triple gene block protein 3 [Butterbur mosaic virus]BAI49695.1 triple gene block protein 3 [Butterbur mosaic virus]